jgi:hypothetical protein
MTCIELDDIIALFKSWGFSDKDPYDYVEVRYDKLVGALRALGELRETVNKEVVKND